VPYPRKSTALGRALHEWRAALVADLGGDDAVSTQQRALVELAVRTKLQVDSIDAYILSLPALVDKRHRRVWPVVKDRQSLVDQLQSILKDLGLERRQQHVDVVAEVTRLHSLQKDSLGENPQNP
jgi:hypothetical protein